MYRKKKSIVLQCSSDFMEIEYSPLLFLTSLKNGSCARQEKASVTAFLANIAVAAEVKCGSLLRFA